MAAVDEVWVSGMEFFSPVERYFPEISAKLRRFANGDELYRHLIPGRYFPIPITGSVFPKTLQSKLLAAAHLRHPVGRADGRFPLIAVTLRGNNRRCENLDECILAVIQKLKTSYPTMGIVIDGYVRPEHNISDGTPQVDFASDHEDHGLSAERSQAEELQRSFPGIVVRNLVGKNILHSISGISDVDLYIAHIGTLQHKIAFFSEAYGIVHGPSHLLTTQKHWQFFSEVGRPPLFCEPGSVLDLTTATPLGEPDETSLQTSDYRIRDPSAFARSVEDLLKNANSS
jgi:hypothetical protein